MNTYNKTLQEFAAEYEESHQGEAYTKRELAVWAIQNKKWSPPLQDITDILARDLGRALRTSYKTDDKGRRLRTRIPVRETRMIDGELKQLSFWHHLDTAPPNVVAKFFGQQRERAKDFLWQTKQSLDGYNEDHNMAAPIDFDFDFREDMAEEQFKLDLGDDDLVVGVG